MQRTEQYNNNLQSELIEKERNIDEVNRKLKEITEQYQQNQQNLQKLKQKVNF